MTSNDSKTSSNASIIGDLVVPEPYVSMVSDITNDILKSNSELKQFIQLQQSDSAGLEHDLATMTSLRTKLQDVQRFIQKCVTLSSQLKQLTFPDKQDVLKKLSDTIDMFTGSYRELKEAYEYCIKAQLKRLDLNMIMLLFQSNNTLFTA